MFIKYFKGNIPEIQRVMLEIKNSWDPLKIEYFVDIIYTGIEKKNNFHKKTLSQWRERKVSGCFLYFYINKENG